MRVISAMRDRSQTVEVEAQEGAANAAGCETAERRAQLRGQKPGDQKFPAAEFKVNAAEGVDERDHRRSPRLRDLPAYQGFCRLTRSSSARVRYSSTRLSIRVRVILVNGSAAPALVNRPTFA